MINFLFKIRNYFKYPAKVSQRVLNSTMTFKVYNPIEEDRVIGSNSEIDFTIEIISELQPTDTYFDIGSCIGFTAIAAAKNQRCRVFAFEPDRELAGHLRHNIELNGVADKIQVNEWAVSDTDGTIDFFTSGAAGASPSLAQTQNQSNKVTVQTRTIDTAVKDNTLVHPSVIKLDIEGAELMALKGMKNVLGSPNPPRTIFIESHPAFMTHFNHTVDMLRNFLSEHHYREEYVKKRGDEFHHKFVNVLATS